MQATEINTEAQAVEALELLVNINSVPVDPIFYFEARDELKPSLWLAWLVRQGMVIRQDGDGYGACLDGSWRMFFWNPSPLVAAARAYLEGRE